MKYGISRALPMGILGFLLGMLLTFILRSWQGLTPSWDPEVGIVLGAIVGSVLFVWSMGAFDPAMSAHGDEEHGDEHAIEAHAAHDTHAEKPHVSVTKRVENALHRVLAAGQQVMANVPGGGVLAVIGKLLLAIIVLIVLLIPLLLLALLLMTLNVINYMRHMGGDVFLITSIILILLIGIAAVALIPNGPNINITNDPVGSPTGNGYITINLFGTDFIFTKLALFAIFIIWTVLSLAAAGGAIALLMGYLSREVRAVKGKAPAPEALIPPLPVRLISRGATWLLNRLPEPPKPQR